MTMTLKMSLGLCAIVSLAGSASAQLHADNADDATSPRIARATARTLLASSRGAPGQFDEAGDIPGCLLGVSFDDMTINTLIRSNDVPDGGSFEGIETALVVDNAGAVATPGFAGPFGGPDPDSERGNMLQLRRTSDSTVSLQLAEARHNRYAPAPGRPLFVTIDLYKPDHKNVQFWRPVSFTEGLYVSGCITGGVFPEGGQFDEMAQAFGDPLLLEGMMVLHSAGGGSSENTYFLNEKEVAPGGWYTLGVLLQAGEGADAMSVWVRDAETSGPSSLDVRTPMRTTGLFAGTRMFSELGFGLEEGWAQVFPGTIDDPATVGIVEGFGVAVGNDGPGLAPTPARFLDENGSAVARYWAGFSVDAWRLWGGWDTTPAVDPAFVRQTWWADEYCVRGGRRVDACPGDLNADGVTDSADLASLLASWGRDAGVEGTPRSHANAELDGEVGVNSGDLAMLLASWGLCP